MQPQFTCGVKLRWRRETCGPEHRVPAGRYFQYQNTLGPESRGFALLIARMQPQHDSHQQHQAGAEAEGQIAVGKARHKIPGHAAAGYKQRIAELCGNMLHMIAA